MPQPPWPRWPTMRHIYIRLEVTHPNIVGKIARLSNSSEVALPHKPTPAIVVHSGDHVDHHLTSHKMPHSIILCKRFKGSASQMMLDTAANTSPQNLTSNIKPASHSPQIKPHCTQQKWLSRKHMETIQRVSTIRSMLGLQPAYTGRCWLHHGLPPCIVNRVKSTLICRISAGLLGEYSLLEI